jgi:hypothetical protein
MVLFAPLYSPSFLLVPPIMAMRCVATATSTVYNEELEVAIEAVLEEAIEEELT